MAVATALVFATTSATATSADVSVSLTFDDEQRKIVFVVDHIAALADGYIVAAPPGFQVFLKNIYAGLPRHSTNLSSPAPLTFGQALVPHDIGNPPKCGLAPMDTPADWIGIIAAHNPNSRTRRYIIEYDPLNDWLNPNCHLHLIDWDPAVTCSLEVITVLPNWLAKLLGPEPLFLSWIDDGVYSKTMRLKGLWGLLAYFLIIAKFVVSAVSATLALLPAKYMYVVVYVLFMSATVISSLYYPALFASRPFSASVLYMSGFLLSRGVFVLCIFASVLCLFASFLCFAALRRVTPCRGLVASLLCVFASVLCSSAAHLCMSVSLLCASAEMLCVSAEMLCMFASMLCIFASVLCIFASFLCIGAELLCLSASTLCIAALRVLVPGVSALLWVLVALLSHVALNGR